MCKFPLKTRGEQDENSSYEPAGAGCEKPFAFRLCHGPACESNPLLSPDTALRWSSCDKRGPGCCARRLPCNSLCHVMKEVYTNKHYQSSNLDSDFYAELSS